MNRQQIAQSLKLASIKSGDLVFMHSSLSAIGNVDGGADTVVDAFLDVLGSDGTFAVSTLSSEGPFDVKTTKSAVGAISEAVRLRPNAERSLRPFHSIAAIGRLAKELTADHDKALTNCGEGTPYTKLRDLNGKIVLLGVDMNRNTTLHSIEDIMNVTYLEELVVAMPTYVPDYQGKTMKLVKFPPGHRDFLRFTPLLRKNGILKEGCVGNATIKVIDVRKMFELGIETLAKDPMFFMCENENCWSCPKKRSAANV